MRYAIYFTPPAGHPLVRTAAEWLGRDAFTDNMFEIPNSRKEITKEARRYGFHATLKAPFELHANQTEANLLDAVRSFCNSHHSFTLPCVSVSQMGGFFALIPEITSPQLQEFASKIVQFFDPFRAPLGDKDIARRKPHTLSPRQLEHLIKWGYPYVLDQFQFHMTLTGRIADENADRVSSQINQFFEAYVDQPLSISGIAVFVEPTHGADFQILSWVPLQNSY